MNRPDRDLVCPENCNFGSAFPYDLPYCKLWTYSILFSSFYSWFELSLRFRIREDFCTENRFDKTQKTHIARKWLSCEQIYDLLKNQGSKAGFYLIQTKLMVHILGNFKTQFWENRRIKNFLKFPKFLSNLKMDLKFFLP